MARPLRPYGAGGPPAKAEPAPFAGPTRSLQPQGINEVSPRARGPVAPAFDSSIEWAAEITQPTSTIVRGSEQPLVVTVSSPFELTTQAVEFRIGELWRPAGWRGDEGHTREASLVLGDFVPRGKTKVYVRVHQERQTPVLLAGWLRAR